MGYIKTDKCLQMAFEDEMLFVLMARDFTAPSIILEWVKQNKDLQPKEKLLEAFDCAMEMQKQYPSLVGEARKKKENMVNFRQAVRDQNLSVEMVKLLDWMKETGEYFSWDVPTEDIVNQFLKKDE